MADPQFRSLSQIIGEMVSTFLSELNTKGIAPGIQSLKPGSPYLAIFEAVAQSQFRNQEQTLSLLDANDLDIAHDERLDRIGLSENLPRRGATFASGYVTLSDTSFTKKSDRIYQGKPAPIAGSNVIYVGDASTWPATGSVYVGRGTTSLEGPLAYASLVNAGAYWQVNLSVPLAKFHGYGETVTVAQGGDRTVSAGQAVSTPIGGPSATSISYSTTQSVTVLDGETEVANVPVVAQAPGANGNTSAGSISYVSSPAFAGMAVTNPQPLSNALDLETDDLYRARIKSVRQSRQRGTRTAIETFAYGATAPDESSTCIAAQLIQRNVLPTLLVIDDGTGYEEKSAGISAEVLVDSAIGGEDTFYLRHGRPVAKASVTTTLTAPFALKDGDILSVVVRQKQYDHLVLGSMYLNVAAASAYEVVNCINSDSSLPFKAHTVGNGLQVAIFVETDDNDDIQVVGGTANEALKFPTAKVETLRLYKNDRLLTKDGQTATVLSTSQGSWGILTSGETFTISVDGTASQTYYITDADFVALGTGLTAVSAGNPLTAWAAVFNNKVPGVTTSVVGATLQLVSNRDRSNSASIVIDPASSLVQKGMFAVDQLSATGKSNDYVLNKNIGEVELLTPLAVGDSLVAGSPFTRGYLESTAPFTSITIASTANLWFVLDGADATVHHSMTGANRVRMAWTQDITPMRRFTAYVGAPGGTLAYPFTSLKPGDWAIFTDDTVWGGAHPTTFGAYRVANISENGDWFDVEDVTSLVTATSDSDATIFSKLFFVRTQAQVQHVSVPAATYTPTTLAAALSAGLVGGFSSATSHNTVTVTTATYALEGKVSLVAMDATARSLLLPLESSTNNDTHIAAVESGHSAVGIPHITAVSGDIQTWNGTLKQITGTGVLDIDSLSSGWIHSLQWMRSDGPADEGDVRYQSNVGRISNLIQDFTYAGTTATIDNVIHDIFTAAGDPNHGYKALVTSGFRFGPESVLNLVLDQDPLSKGFAVPMFRRVIADAAFGPYNSTIRLKDLDNLNGLGNPQSLALAFGTSFDFGDFVLHAHSRAVTHPSTASKSVLWRVKDFNIRGPNLYVSYLAPIAASATLSVKNADPYGAPNIVLASGADRGVTVTANSKWSVKAGLTQQTFASALAIATLVRVGTTVTATVTLPGDIVAHGLSGNVWVESASGDFLSGVKTIVSTGPTTFTYTEAGSAVTYNGVAGDYVNLDGGNFAADFTSVLVGDYVSISDFAATSVGMPTLVNGLPAQTAQVTSKGQYWFRTRTLGAVGVGWFVVQPTWFSFYPLTSNTAANIVTAVNALTGPSASLRGTLLGNGTGVISADSQEDPTEARAILHDGLLHISRLSAYNNAGSANTYDIVLKVAPNSTLVSQSPDWAHEEFRLVPTTTKNVVDFLNSGNVTGLASTGASILVANRAEKVQIASGTLGSGSAVQVSGGTANNLTMPVLSRSVISGNVVVTVPYTSDLAACANRQMVAVNNSVAIPKTLDWDSTTSFAVDANGVVTLGASGTAWGYSNGQGILFGDQWYVEKVGTLTAITCGRMGGVDPVMPNVGDWVTFEGGVGAWSEVVDATTGLPAYKATQSIGATILTLLDGRVLFAGGTNTYDVNDGGQTPYNQTYLFNPVNNTWVAGANMGTARAWARAVLLTDGKVLVTGGITAGSTWTATCEIYDPGADTWTTITPMSVARSHHTATVTTSSTTGSTITVVGGTTTGGVFTDTVEQYNTVTGLWSPLPSMTVTGTRSNHCAVMSGSRLLVFGGKASVGGQEKSIVSYNVYTGVWTTVGTMQEVRCDANYVIHGNDILVFGGSTAGTTDPTGWATSTILNSAESINLSTFSTTFLAPMKVKRALASAVHLGDGRVLLVGGISSAILATSVAVTKAAEIYDPVGNSWSWAVGPLYAHGTYGDVVLLSDGRILGTQECDENGIQGSNGYSEYLDLSQPGASTGNLGRFRVALVDAQDPFNHTLRIFIEIPDSVNEKTGFGRLTFYNYDSVQVGDTFRVRGAALGNASYDGDYVVTSLDLVDPTKFTVAGLSNVSLVTPGASKLPYLNVLPSAPSRMLFEVLGIYPNDASSTVYNLALSPSTHSELVSEQAGSVVEFLDRLNFPTDLSVGQDGYRYNTGLIGEVNRIVYGDPRDTTTYPGVAAAGAYIDVAAPLIRRVSVAVAIRVLPGVVDVKSRVQSAVAKVINGAPPAPIAISDIVEAVSGVYGVVSCVMLDPVPTATADVIPVQPGEKAMILDIDNDVQVTFIGA